MSIESQIKNIALQYFNQAGFTQAGAPPTLGAYASWLQAGRHGEMGYLERHLEKKGDPTLLLPKAQSWIVLILNYDTQEPLSVELQDLFYRDKMGWIARYARGGDYHEEIHRRHVRIIEELQKLFPSESFLSCVDTKAVLERDVAAQAGLGWIGKNTCLINQKLGSFLFLSEILTTLNLESDRPVADHCGTCTRCLEACPTGALESPRMLDATKCISYWTIEAKTPPPVSLAPKFGYQFFGCDICQDVCPWNQKARKQNSLPAPTQSGVVDLEKILSKSDQELKEMTAGSAMSRAKPAHLKRNAAVALENIMRKQN